MTRHSTSEPLRHRLVAAGIVVAPDDQARPLESPWYIKALLAFSGWLASLFILGFLGIALSGLFDSSVASVGSGMVMIAIAFGALRVAGNDFLEHGALAVSLTGQLLVAWGIARVLDIDLGSGFWWALVVLQTLLAWGMPNFVHRVFSAFAASLAFTMAMMASGLPYLAGNLLLVGIVWVWMNEFRFADRIRPFQAWGYGLVLGLMAASFLMRYQGPGWFRMAAGEPLTRPWMGEAIAALAVFYLLWQLFQRARRVARSSTVALTFAVVAVLCLVSLEAYGLTQGMVILILGFSRGNRLLLGLGVVLLLVSLSSYYYWLEATLLVKSQILLALGLVLLLSRWAMRYLPKPEEDDA